MLLLEGVPEPDAVTVCVRVGVPVLVLEGVPVWLGAELWLAVALGDDELAEADDEGVSVSEPVPLGVGVALDEGVAIWLGVHVRLAEELIEDVPVIDGIAV